MKTSSRTILVLGLIAGIAMANMTFADAGGGNGSSGSDNGKGNGGHNNGGGNGGGNVPAAPEPGLMLMAASGIALGGGYIVWRRKQTKHTSAS